MYNLLKILYFIFYIFIKKYLKINYIKYNLNIIFNAKTNINNC
jgi:hypothetical protein